MTCYISCFISFVFIVGMIYFYNSVNSSNIVKQYENQLTAKQQVIYKNIANERLHISMKGYMIGLILSIFVIYYNYSKKILHTNSVVCLVLSISFVTNYFYYKLTPKTDWMLNHVENKTQSQAWLQMYKSMQYYYHFGLMLGIIGICILAYAFKC